MPDRAQVIVALDFGLKRIGIASGDTLTRAAHPRSTISNGPNGPDWRAIERVLADTRPARIAVGEPYNADGSVSPLTDAARRFATELATAAHCPSTWSMNAGPRRTPKSACANSARAASAGGE
jgi:putative Holliday junction resolvase